MAATPLVRSTLPRSRRRALQVLGGLVAGWAGAPAAAVQAGEAAPDIELPECPLGPRLSALRGRVVYLDFWASWCTPCRLSFPWMGTLQQRHGRRGLVVVAVNLDARRADAEAFLARHPAGFALAFDPAGRSAEAFAVRGMPSSVLIDATGRVRWTHRGFRTDEADALEARVVAALPAAG